ncbi:MAG: LysM peptidoglycan-binding domain-containing protein [Hyphomicrobiales bacterium]|nr:LysM peptidoglycan-binding domain-containing protein [Hyphomicrobiales bacterium]
MNRPLIIAAVGVAAVALAIGLNYGLNTDSELTENATETAPQTASAPPAAKAPDAAGAGASTADSAAPADGPAKDLADLTPPSFDVVRVNPQGDSVMAGRATPGATVLIMESGKVIGQVQADSRGEWVFVPDRPLNPGDRQLTLEMQVAGKPAVKSEEAVVLVVPEKGKDIAGRPAETPKQRKPLAMKVPLKDGRPTVVLQKPTADAVADAAPMASAAPATTAGTPEASGGGVMRAPTSNTAAATAPQGPTTPAAPAAPAAKAGTGAATATTALADRSTPPAVAEAPRVMPSGARKLPPVRPPQQPAGADTRLSVDTVDYDDDGRLTISGQAATEARVQVYLNNDFMGRAAAGADSRWSLSPERMVAPGLYALRADQVDGAGKVVSRVMFPFARAEPLTQVAQGDFVIVQPGNSLWRIARRTYGAGTRYTVIFDANRDQIRDADLIYPGQIFAVPPSN